MIPSNPEPELRAPGSLRRQCLFAVTILLVEDSRSASEAIRLYAAESGARVRRADSLHAASRHLAIYRPNVVMVDLGLPDGERHGADPAPRLGLDAARGDRGAERARARRLAGGGDGGGGGGLPREADREPQGVPGVPALGPARRRDPARAGRARAGARRAGLGRGGAGRGHAAGAGAPRRGAAGGATSRRWPIARSSSARSARCSATASSSPPPAAPTSRAGRSSSPRWSSGGSGRSGGGARSPERVAIRLREYFYQEEGSGRAKSRLVVPNTAAVQAGAPMTARGEGAGVPSALDGRLL